MDRIVVSGNGPLRGDVTVSGSKNATLALMAAALLGEGRMRLENVPRLRDVDTMLEILRALGAEADWDPDCQDSLWIDPEGVHSPEAPYELVRKMRASFLVLGPLLARFGRARVSEPGGCAIGVRPVDQHLKGFQALGAKVRLERGYVEASAVRLRGGSVAFDLSTVNGTQNVMMAACLAEGETVLENCAREPEVVELAHVLQRMGAEIHGVGSDRLSIQGVSGLRGVSHRVSGDRIEAGTMLIAGLATRGLVRVLGVDPSVMDSTLQKLRE